MTAAGGSTVEMLSKKRELMEEGGSLGVLVLKREDSRPVWRMFMP